MQYFVPHFHILLLHDKDCVYFYFHLHMQPEAEPFALYLRSTCFMEACLSTNTYALWRKIPVLTFALFPPHCLILQSWNATLCLDNGNVHSFTVIESRPDSIFGWFTYFLHQWRVSEVCEWRPDRREVLPLLLCLRQFSQNPQRMSWKDDVVTMMSSPWLQLHHKGSVFSIFQENNNKTSYRTELV